MADLLIREARPGDRVAIRDVTLTAYGEYAAQLPPPFWEAYRENILETLAEGEQVEQLVAEQGGAITGTVLLYPPRTISSPEHQVSLQMPWPEVRLLAVAPSARGRGVGEALMQECVRRARRSGSGYLSLHTTEFMQAAMRMYARMGFVRAPELDFEPAPGLTIEGYRLDLGTGAA